MSDSVEFDIYKESKNKIKEALMMSFGVDALLSKVMPIHLKGANVDTIPMVREWIKDGTINVSSEFQNKFNEKEKYDSHKYHNHSNYKSKGKVDKELHENNELKDKYTGNILKRNEKRNLDHIISAKEIDSDPATLLSGLDGSDVANDISNFQSTEKYLNINKSAKTMTDWINGIDQTILDKEEKIKTIEKNKIKIENSSLSKKEKEHKIREANNDIKKQKYHIDKLKEVDKEKALEIDAKARQKKEKTFFDATYNKEFAKDSLKSAGKSGIAIGLSELTGLIFLEVFNEFSDNFKDIKKDFTKDFNLKSFLNKIKIIMKKSFDNIYSKWKDILRTVGYGFIKGFLSDLTKTLINLVKVTTKKLSRIIKEAYSGVINVVRMLRNNSEKMNKKELVQGIIWSLGSSAAIISSILLIENIQNIIPIPSFLAESVEMFLEAVCSGLIIVLLTYFIYHSPTMQKIFNYLLETKSYIKNKEALDKYIDEHIKVIYSKEFNIDLNELKDFRYSLFEEQDEDKRSVVINDECSKRNLSFDFEDNDESTLNWLKNLKK